MVTVATMPDLARFASSRVAACSGMFIAFGLGGPLLLALAVVPSLSTGRTDIMDIVVGLGLGLPGLIALALSSWTCNAANLFSTSLSLKSIFERVDRKFLAVLGGLLGAGLALGGIIDRFVPFLLFLGVIIPPIAAIYWLDSLRRYRSGYPPATQLPGYRKSAIIAWALSTAAGTISALGMIAVTGVPSLDATLTAIVAYGIADGWMGRSSMGGVSRLN